MKIFDLHCDTILACWSRETALRENGFHIDLQKLKAGDSLAQCFAIFLHQKMCEKMEITPFDLYTKMVNVFKSEMERNSDMIRQARNSAEILANAEKGLLSGFLTVEGGEVLGGDINRLDTLYKDGVRMMTLTWNFENELGFSHMQGGNLKPFGKEAVEKMLEMGIVPDVSHLSDEGFADVAAICKAVGKPFAASHSCARTLCNHTRNLTDDMLKTLGESGGVVGVNFCSEFLREECEDSYISDVVAHTLYMVNMAGVDAVAIGSDFDGIGSNLEWKNFAGMPMIVDALSAKLSASDIEKICYKNALRLFE